MFVVVTSARSSHNTWSTGAGKPRGGAALVHRQCRSVASGSPCCSQISPRRWPKGRGKAQAASLRGLKQTASGEKAAGPQQIGRAHITVSATELRKGDVVLIEAGDYVPADAEVIEGAASRR